MLDVFFNPIDIVWAPVMLRVVFGSVMMGAERIERPLKELGEMGWRHVTQITMLLGWLNGGAAYGRDRNGKSGFCGEDCIELYLDLLGFNKKIHRLNEYFHYKEDKQLMMSANFYWTQTWLRTLYTKQMIHKDVSQTCNKEESSCSWNWMYISNIK